MWKKVVSWYFWHLFCKCEWYFSLCQSLFFCSLLLKYVSRDLDPFTVWMSLCSLVQHITEELSLSLALPLEIFQACESPGEPQDALKYEKSRCNQKGNTSEELSWRAQSLRIQCNTYKTRILFSPTWTNCSHAPESQFKQTNHEALGNTCSRKIH